LIALFTLPVTVVAHLQGVQQAGYLAFAISVLSMICAVFQPVGLVLLPKATHMLAEGSHRELRAHVSQLLKISVLISLVLTLFVALFATQLFRIYLGQGYEQVAGLVRIMVIGTIPYSIYLVLRNIIDAFHKNGVTALILLLSLAVFGGGVALRIGSNAPCQAVETCFLVALVVMAVICAWECKRILLSAAETI
jgi:O-antigen/teichoic acid export membrane protein